MNNTQNKGITLIALIITVIIMLILAGVAISTLTGDGGLIARITGATDEYNKSVANEAESINSILEELDNLTNNEPGVVAPELGVVIPSGDGGTDVTTEADCGVIEIAWLDKSNNVIASPLAPELMGMKKVAWDGATEVPEASINTNAQWYNYSENRWANAINDGSYFVWIPRYAYKIIYFDNNTSLTNYINNSGPYTIIGYYTKDGKINVAENKIIIPTEEGIKSPTTTGYTDYIVHPAFEDNVDLGGWDSQLSGMWVAKYEMSMEIDGVARNPTNAETGNIATSSSVKAVSKPGRNSWRYINIANMYENSYDYDRTKESHLMKNSERGAVAYLTHSKYGRNAVEITPNLITSYITGGSTTIATIYGANANQSTTGNAYGIYDMSGGAKEYIAAFNNKGNMNFFIGSNRSKKGTHFASKDGESTKYATAYANGDDTYRASTVGDFNIGRSVSITGDGIKEVWSGETRNWFKDYGNYVNFNFTFVSRGGSWEDGVFAGVFAGKERTRRCVPPPAVVASWSSNK